MEEAIISCDKALEIQPDDHEVWYNRGWLLFELGRLKEAITSYDKAINFKRDYHEAWQFLALALEDLGRFKEAITSYDEAIHIKPDYEDAWTNRGNLLQQLRRWEEALSSYNFALQLRIDNWHSWIGRGSTAGNLVHPAPLSGFAQKNNSSLNQGGYKRRLAIYEEGLKYVCQDTHPEGWGRLHWAIGKAHYAQGSVDSKPFYYWRKAVTEYKKGLKTLVGFPEAYLEVLQDLIQSQLGLGETIEAEELGRRGTDLLRRLQENSKSPVKKKHLAFKFASFNQLTVDLAVHSGNWCAALEIAEQGKNACLSWLLYAGSDEIASPKWREIEQLLNPTTAIVYWHLSPVALTTFILKHNAPSPIVITTLTPTNEELPRRMQRLRELENWGKKWDQEYTKYRSKAKDEQTRRNHYWRTGMIEELEALKNILNITEIERELKGITQLVLIPHRDLHRFPLHALFNVKFGFTITYLPSAQIGLTLQKRQSTSNYLLSVEAPTSKKAVSLEFAQVESEVISQMFDRPKRIQAEQATKKRVEDALSTEYGVFHFTGHGIHNFGNPKESELALAGEDKLTLEEICKKNLTSYNLVSLSACETAIAGNQTITTEYVGLASSFVSRGAAQVVSTLWTVESAPTTLVMIEFYRWWQTGKPEATALAEATQWLRELTVEQLKEWYEALLAQLPPNELRISAFLETELDRIKKISSIEPNEKLYDHPYYWAAFTITGNSVK